MNKRTLQKPLHHDDILNKALLRLIDIYIPSRFKNEREMAEALGIIPSHFSQLKNGHKAIGKSTIEKIERGLHLGITGIYRFAEDGDVVEEDLDTLVARYARSGETLKALVDLTLSHKKPPVWVTKSILTLHKGLVEAIGEALERHKKSRSSAKRS